MAGVHRLQHVEGFLAADLADDDAVGTHTQGVDRPAAAAGWRPCLRRSAAAFRGATRAPGAAAVRPRPRSSRCARARGMKLDSTLSSVVLPAPVPPLIRQFSRARTQCDRKSSIGRVSARRVTRSSALSRSAGKRRIESSGPSTASGGMMALTREPSAQARVHHRRAVVHAAADAADDAVDDAHQVRVVLERGRHAFEHGRRARRRRACRC